ncbi:agmatinase, mitochondrial [Nematostella vectensis]|uniref:agmatinase, mitochondrial n=1 Tax=Nematostella vectensis TaxID=45351 RepID=UPI002076FB1A|nr:agmatinase, mitochondrial [Nematostella vectensis]
MPRAGGIATMMRLPHQKSAVGLDACFVGVPFDTGTSNKTGTRYGPRQIRWESSMLRPYNPATGAAPFESLMVADVGDIPINNFNISKTVDIIRTKIEEFICDGCFPLTMGGDHTITYPILQAIKNKHGPVGLVHVDAHMDLHNKMCDEAVYHGSPFFRAFEEGLLDPKRVVQIGLRGSLYDNNAYNIPKDFVSILSHREINVL